MSALLQWARQYLQNFHLGTAYLCFTKLNTRQILTCKFYKFSHFSTLPRQLLTEHWSEKSDKLVTRHPLNPISVKSCTLQRIDTCRKWRRNELPQTSCTCQWRLCTTFNSTGVQATSIQCCGPVECRGKWPRQADLVNGKTVPTWCFQSRQSITSYCQIPELCLCLTLWCLVWPTAYSATNYYPSWNCPQTPMFRISHCTFNSSKKELHTSKFKYNFLTV